MRRRGTGRALGRIAATAGGPALVVAHGEVMQMWLTDAIGVAIPPVENGAAYAVEHGLTGIHAQALRAVRPGGSAIVRPTEGLTSDATVG